MERGDLMGYMHIPNLYKSKTILLFRECYALEKVHGTSVHVSYDTEKDALTFFSGGCKHEQFVSIFDSNLLLENFRKNAVEHPAATKITVYGEGYGGKMQGMSDTYGKQLKFVAFEVLVNPDSWLSVPQAEALATKLGFEFVSYERIDTTEEAINAQMNADSVQAIRNGMGAGKIREGVVLRPLYEFVHPNGGRIVAKHKRPEFAEREHTPRFADPEQLKVLEKANEVVEEWVTPMRLVHVLDKFPDVEMKDVNKIIVAMVEDVFREAKGEIIEDKAVKKAIGKKTVKLFKEHLYRR
jgi:hypothetical protein